jgi:NADH-quinone oxidoreductase subunit K
VVPIWQYLVLSAILFAIGALGVVVRRNLIVIMMSIELMLNAVNLALIAFAKQHGGEEGQVLAFLVIVLAAAEAALGLAILVALRRSSDSVNIDDVNVLKG